MPICRTHIYMFHVHCFSALGRSNTSHTPPPTPASSMPFINFYIKFFGFVAWVPASTTSATWPHQDADINVSTGFSLVRTEGSPS